MSSIENTRKKNIQYMLEKVECPCGTITARSNMTTHRRTNKHQKWVIQNGGGLDDDEIKAIVENLRKKQKELIAQKIY